MSVPPRRRSSPFRRTAGALAAAAAVTGVLAVSAVVRDAPDDKVATPAIATPEPTGTRMVYSAAVLKAAEENPRLLIDRPGWKATTVYGFAEKTGTIAFSNGGRTLEMNWYPGGQYKVHHADRRRVSPPEPVQVDGWRGDLFRYSASDLAVVLEPRDGVFVELRGQGAWNRKTFDEVLAVVKRVDVATWLAALPATIVTPGRVDEAADKVLADVPLPPGFDTSALDALGTNDPYQFGAEVTSLVGCGWIEEWLRAKRAGDDAALQRAGDALRSSHKWKVLHSMNDEGDWPEVFWETADDVAAGDPPAGYQGALGCD